MPGDVTPTLEACAESVVMATLLSSVATRLVGVVTVMDGRDGDNGDKDDGGADGHHDGGGHRNHNLGGSYDAVGGDSDGLR